MSVSPLGVNTPWRLTRSIAEPRRREPASCGEPSFPAFSLKSFRPPFRYRQGTDCQALSVAPCCEWSPEEGEGNAETANLFPVGSDAGRPRLRALLDGHLHADPRAAVGHGRNCKRNIATRTTSAHRSSRRSATAIHRPFVRIRRTRPEYCEPCRTSRAACRSSAKSTATISTCSPSASWTRSIRRGFSRWSAWPSSTTVTGSAPSITPRRKSRAIRSRSAA